MALTLALVKTSGTLQPARLEIRTFRCSIRALRDFLFLIDVLNRRLGT